MSPPRAMARPRPGPGRGSLTLLPWNGSVLWPEAGPAGHGGAVRAGDGGRERRMLGGARAARHRPRRALASLSPRCQPSAHPHVPQHPPQARAGNTGTDPKGRTARSQAAATRTAAACGFTSPRGHRSGAARSPPHAPGGGGADPAPKTHAHDPWSGWHRPTNADPGAVGETRRPGGQGRGRRANLRTGGAHPPARLSLSFSLPSQHSPHGRLFLRQGGARPCELRRA